MYAWHPPRAVSAATSLALVGAMGLLLVFGLGVPRTVERAVPLLTVVMTDQKPPPPPPEPPPPRPKPTQARHASQSAPKHEASPRNVRNQASPVVVPPVVPIKPPPPVATAPLPGVGAGPNTGASNLPGPGQGAGGFGNGTGGGGL